MELTPEQEVLRDNVKRFCAKRRRPRHASRDSWRAMADLGWLMAGLPETLGGLGGGLSEVAVIAAELAAGHAPEPYSGCAVLAPQALITTGRHDARLLPLVGEIIAGSRVLALAAIEPHARWEMARVGTQATVGKCGYTLDGAKTMVLGGPIADTFLVTARTSGEPDEETGISLFLVDRAAPGVRVEDYRLIDRTPVSDVVLDGVSVAGGSMIGDPGDGFAAIDHAASLATVAAAAAAVGAMEAAFWQTRDFLKVRKQFGQQLANFQALRHRMADMYVCLEQARSILHLGTGAWPIAEPRGLPKIASALKIKIGQCAHFVTAQAIQLHGGIGTTEEIGIGNYFRQATVFKDIFGSVDMHLNRLGDFLCSDGDIGI